LGSFKHSNNEIGIWFNVVDFQHSQPHFRYKLIGLNDSWKMTSENYLNYASISPGNYQFEIQARFGKGEWSESKTVKFEILAPIWQRWWFIASLIIAIIVIVYWQYKRKLHQLDFQKNLTIQKLKAEQRALRSQMNPHFISNIVSSVQFLILDGSYNTANKFLRLFSSITRKVFNYSSHQAISVADEVTFLKEYIEIEEIRLEANILFKVEIHSDIVPENTLIPPFINQPLVENAILHGLKEKKKGRRLVLRIYLEKEWIVIEIEDNGLGRTINEIEKKHPEKEEQHSLDIIKQRLAIINDSEAINQLQFEDLKDKDCKPRGTLVKIKMLYIFEKGNIKVVG
jgi:hypothetical protein